MSRWASLVFHVLAHVEGGGGLAPSAYDPIWVDHAERVLGPSGDRPLGDDTVALGASLGDHHRLATAQLLAWLYLSPERAAEHAAAPLAGLSPGDVDAPDLLPPLVALGDGAELLLCAALLEAEPFASLPPLEPAPGAREAVARLARAFPSLARCQVSFVPPLRLRGRVLGDSVLVGLPCEALGVSAGHVAWQAAHEATVGEVARERGARGGTPSFPALEREALDRLARRAARAGLAEEHAAWIARLDLSPVGLPVPV